MATPRSIAGFEKQIAEKDQELKALNDQITDASVEEEDTLIEKRADLEVERAVLISKFEEFKVKEESEGGNSDDETKQDESDDETKPEPEPEPEETWPETAMVSCGDKTTYMVNPHNGVKHTVGNYQKVIIDQWTINQIKAGILVLSE